MTDEPDAPTPPPAAQQPPFPPQPYPPQPYPAQPYPAQPYPPRPMPPQQFAPPYPPAGPPGQPHLPPAPAPLPAPRPPWRERRHRGLFWIAILVTALLVVGGAVDAYGGFRDGDGADGAVRGYLHALASGDAARALSYGTVPAGSQTFLTDQTLADQLKLGPITDVTVGSDSSSSAGTTVEFSYQVGLVQGVQHVSGSVLVRKQGGRWQLTQVARPVQFYLDEAADRAGFAGAELPASTVLLFPGAVPITFDSPYLQLDAADATVGLGSGIDTVTADVQVTSAARTVITRQVSALLATCGKGGSAATGRCPGPSATFVPGSMSGTLALKGGLTLTVALSANGLINISGTASFTGTYQELDFSDVPQTKTGTVPVTFNAAAYAVSPLVVSMTVDE